MCDFLISIIFVLFQFSFIFFSFNYLLISSLLYNRCKSLYNFNYISILQRCKDMERINYTKITKKIGYYIVELTNGYKISIEDCKFINFMEGSQC